jgi:hypothetical protein
MGTRWMGSGWSTRDFMDPSVVLVQTQQEACGRWKSILIQHSVLTLGVGLENKSGARPSRDALKQTNIQLSNFLNIFCAAVATAQQVPLTRALDGLSKNDGMGLLF